MTALSAGYVMVENQRPFAFNLPLSIIDAQNRKRRRASQSDVEILKLSRSFAGVVTKTPTEEPTPLPNITLNQPDNNLLFFALNQASEPMILFQCNSAQLQITHVNNSFEQLSGQNKSFWASKTNINHMLAFKQQLDFQYQLNQSLQSQHDITHKFTIRSPLKNEQYFYVKFSPTQNAVCCTFQLSQQSSSPSLTSSQLESRLSQQSEQLVQVTSSLSETRSKLRIHETIFDCTPYMICLCSVSKQNINNNFPEVRIIMANQSLSNYLQSNPSQMQGSCFAETPFFHEHSANILRTMQESIGTLGQPSHLTIQYGDSYLSCFVKSLTEDTFLFMCNDVTNDKLTAEQLRCAKEQLEDTVKSRTQDLENALKMKSHFLAVMSHEIRTPLSGVLGMLSLLAETPLNSEQNEMVSTAHLCGEQLLVVINDILDFSKMDEKRMSLEQSPFSLTSVIEDSLEVISFDSAKKRIELVNVTPDTELPSLVEGDAARLRQIFVNLLGNSVKFSPEGEVVTVSSKVRRLPPNNNKMTSLDVIRHKSPRIAAEIPSGEFIEIEFTVSDHGIGISEESKKSLFQPFAQADSSIVRRYGGSGLGLVISKQLAELMGGKMWFESELGKGSHFHFTIQVKVINVLRPRFSMADKTTCSVLLIDENPLVLKSLEAKFNNFRFRVVSFESASNALNHLLDMSSHCSPTNNNNNNKLPYDVIFVDSKQPTDTIQLLRQILPCVVMGPFLEPHSQLTLKKPVRESSLRACLQHLLRPSKKEDVSSNFIGASDVPGTNPSQDRMNAGSPTNICGEPEKLSILVAEDNSVNQKVIVKILQSMQYHDVRIANNGKEVVELLKQKHADVILMDVMMPEMTGLEATQIIRSQFDKQPRIIALTAQAFAEEHKGCIRSGMDAVLTKPINKNALANALRQTQLLKEEQEVTDQ